MAAPVLAASATQNSGATAVADPSIALTGLGTINAGDLLVVVHSATATYSTASTPAGWTHLINGKAAGSTRSGDRDQILAKIAAGGETAVVVNTNATAVKYSAQMMRFTGAHASTLPVVQAAAVGTSTLPNSPAITPSGGPKDFTYLSLAIQEGLSTAGAAPSGYTTNANLTVSTSAGGGGAATNVRIAVAYKTTTASSTDDPAAWGAWSTSEDWDAYTLAVYPADAAGSTYTIPTATLVLATLAPALAISDHKVLTIPVAALTLATFAPTVTAPNPQLLTIPVTGLTLSTFAPSVAVSDNRVYTIPVASPLALSTFAPSLTISNHKLLTVPVAPLTLATFAPTVVNPKGHVIPLTPVVLTTFAPTVNVTSASTLVITKTALVLTTFAPSLSISDHKVLTIPKTALLLATLPPAVSVSDHKVLSIGVVALALTTFAPTLTISSSLILVIPTASLSLTTYPPDLGAPAAVLPVERFALGPPQWRAAGEAEVPAEINDFWLPADQMAATGHIGNWWGLRVTGWSAHALTSDPPGPDEGEAPPPTAPGPSGPPYANDIPEAT